MLSCILELREFDGMLASFVWSHFHSRVVRIPLEAWEADGWATHFICRRMAGHKKEQKWTERDWAAAPLRRVFHRFGSGHLIPLGSTTGYPTLVNHSFS